MQILELRRKVFWGVLVGWFWLLVLLKLGKDIHLLVPENSKAICLQNKKLFLVPYIPKNSTKPNWIILNEITLRVKHIFQIKTFLFRENQ